MIKEQIINDLKKVLEKLRFEQPEKLGIVVEAPAEQHGDYATNAAMAIWKVQSAELKVQNFKTPLELAQKIATSYRLLNTEYLDRIEVAPPGFINFWLSRDYLTSQVPQILREGKNYGAIKVGGGRKIQVEFISANPTGPLHMGNIRGGPLGDVLANVLKKAGYRVKREFYVNDVGHQVEILTESLAGVKTEPLAPEAYRGSYYEKLAEKINTLYLQEREGVVKLTFFRQKALEIILESIKKDCDDLGIVFDNWTLESEILKSGKTKAVIEKLKTGGVVREKERALWFAPNDEFLKDRECVLLRSDGSPTYFANDIAYHWNKLEERKYDLVIDIWGANHHGHAPRMKAAMVALGIDPERLKIILYQWVSLVKEGKKLPMSKRKGEFITAREVFEEIGSDAMRFLLSLSSANNHLELDLDLAKQKAAENPVFYVQYAHARICSIFKKAPQVDFEKTDYTLLKDLPELRLLGHLIKLPEFVEEISKSYAVHLLPAYAIKLADLFHKFYEECRVISKDSKLTAARLGLVRATKVTLVNILSLLGISTPEKM